MDISKIKEIKIEDFNYPLPDDRIALHPLAQRDACKLIVSLPGEEIRHRRFTDLTDFIPAGTLLICNETKVINARMEFFRATGGRIEVFLLEPYSPADYVLSFAAQNSCIWTCMIGNLKKWKEDTLVKELYLPGSDTPVLLRASLLPLAEGETPSATRRVKFEWDEPNLNFASIVETAGNIPIPPYLKRDSEKSDLDDYQTVYSRVQGSVAAPTAGLHFTPQLFDSLITNGVEIKKVTLHVGAGTFQPVKSDHIGDHPMHTETIHVDLAVIESIIKALEEERPVMAVGTTSVRTIESLPYFGYLARTADVADSASMHLPQWLAYSDMLAGEDTLTLLRTLRDKLKEAGLDALTASTAIMIAPGFRWRIIDGMVTNFHQPESTLLLLVSSFMERNRQSTGEESTVTTPLSPDDPKLPAWRRLYNEALANGYRFLSYGDACFIR